MYALETAGHAFASAEHHVAAALSVFRALAGCMFEGVLTDDEGELLKAILDEREFSRLWTDNMAVIHSLGCGARAMLLQSCLGLMWWENFLQKPWRIYIKRWPA